MRGGQDKLPELGEAEFRRNGLPSCAFRHFVPWEKGTFDRPGREPKTPEIARFCMGIRPNPKTRDQWLTRPVHFHAAIWQDLPPPLTVDWPFKYDDKDWEWCTRVQKRRAPPLTVGLCHKQ